MYQVATDDVDSDVESRHRKARATLNKLKAGKFDKYWSEPWTGARNSCPFCTKSIKVDFRSVLQHAEAGGSGCLKVGETVNRSGFIANHMAYGLFLRKKLNQAIETGRVPPPKPKPPKIKGMGSKKQKKRDREEATGRRW